MENKHSNLSEHEFYCKYIELINRGLSDNSPEMIELFRNRALQKSTNINQTPQNKPRVRIHSNRQHSESSQISRQKTPKIRTTQYEHSSVNKSNENQRKNLKSHIVIDSHGTYTLLDANLNTIDTMQSNPIFNFFTRKFKLGKFKKQLRKDKRAYKKNCKLQGCAPDKNFLEMYRKTKFYLSICPDADYQILELLRNNMQQINPNYCNYQTACAEYLYELSQYFDGDPDNMPFDINFCCDQIENDHAYIAYQFDPSPNPVQAFKALYRQKNNVQSDFQSNIRYDAKVPNTKFTNVRKVRTDITHDDRI